MQCSVAVYNEQIPPQVDGTTFTDTEYLAAPEASSAKTVLCTLMKPDTVSKPVFIFSIRGSASVFDHMVNLNGDNRNVEDFIVRKLFAKRFTQG